MKKSKLSFGLVTSFITAMSLSACGNNVTAKKDALVTFTPYGEGDPVEIVTNDMYRKYHNTNDGISKFYSQILEVLIRYDFKKNGDGANGMLTLKEIEEKAANDVKEEKSKARDAGDYNTEWKNVLESYDVENEAELKEYFIYKREKEEISKVFLNNNIDQLRKEFVGVDTTGEKVASAVDSALPYHIRHILVKTDANSSDYVNSLISETDANKLFNVISKLKDGRLSFAQIAYDESDDGSGKKAYGDVGIVTNLIQSSGSLKMVPEFQLGIYAYDAILSGKTNATIDKGLGITGEYKNTSTSIKEAYRGVTNLVKVPYDAVVKLNEYKDIEKDKYGTELSDGNPIVYPRNIIWNKYFNHHQVFVITNAQRNEGENNNLGNTAAITNTVAQFNNIASTTNFDATLGDRFVNVPGICANANEKVLTDGSGNVILGVRSEFGIHLIIIEKSVYDFANSDVTLEEYYTTEVPGSSKFPKKADGTNKNTYVNFINTTTTTDYNTRVKDVKDEIKGFDSTYDYRLYEKLMADYASQIKFTGENGQTLKDSIAKYLDVTRAKKAHTQEEGINSVWQGYLEMLELQGVKRNTYFEQESDKYKSLMIPEGCAVNFKNGGADYKEGGKCYYAK